MNKRMIVLLMVCLMLSAAVLTACNASASKTPTLIFNSDSCTYEGPKTVPSTFTMVSRANEFKENEWYIYVIVTLKGEKTLDDLKNLNDEEGQPEWVNLISRDLSDPTEEEISKVHNLKVNALYQGEPIYIVCFNNGGNIGAIGPIQVKD
jgi:hypothetical protein